MLLQDEEFLKRYLEYTRFKCSPRLTEAAADMLQNEYVAIRREVGHALLKLQGRHVCLCAAHSFTGLFNEHSA